MIDLFELVPSDITDVWDVTMRNRWYEDNDRLRKARELRVKHRDLSETIIPMKWDTEGRTWIEDKSASRIRYAGMMNVKIDEDARKEWVDEQMVLLEDR